ncbi:hypothetical protein K474DRAFT_1765355 [Panus rudis PR-1116 ss-1]|nr:hypothetical protein K474DRAFT_1765355 [Panus rudis PR-1116 ss-1]
MASLIWHQYGRFVSLSATVYTIWAAFWGFWFRKFFFDFATGIVRSPGGVQPSPSVSFFITIIVKAPIVQIISMLVGIALLALEYPAPFLKDTSLSRSFVFKGMMLIAQFFFALLYYQGTNGAIWSLIGAMCYARATMLGEEMEVAKANRGRGGKA